MVKIPKKEATDQSICTETGMVFQYMSQEKPGSRETVAINHTPVIDIFSIANNVIIEIELAGVRQDEIELSILNNTITATGLKYECFDEKKINFVCIERVFGKFFKIIDVPCPVDTTKIKAVLKDGLLTITLPKIAEKRGTPNKIVVET